MPYYTSFELEIPNTSLELKQKIIEEFRNKYSGARLGLDEFGGTNNSVKWYDWQEELEALSAAYKDIIFIMYGDGEGNRDIWRSFTKNGVTEIQVAKIVFDDPPSWANE
jgi:hypothetical protein